jgi:hypothetical protein
MVTTPLTTLLGSAGMFYGILLPIMTLQIFALVLIPSLVKGGRMPDVAKATYCYAAQGIGIVLMASGALPSVYAVLAQQQLVSMAYAGLLFTFAIGGLVFLVHDRQALTLDAASRVVPEAVFFYTWKFVGLLLTVLGALSLLLQLLLQGAVDLAWELHAVILLFGVILLWCTLENEMKAPAFNSSPMLPKTPVPSPAPKLFAKKSKGKGGLARA